MKRTKRMRSKLEAYEQLYFKTKLPKEMIDNIYSFIDQDLPDLQAITYAKRRVLFLWQSGTA